jgi:hypothetical protein
VTSDIKKIVALGVSSRVQHNRSSVTGSGSVAGSVVFKNLYVRSEFQLQLIVVGVRAPSHDRERADSVGNAVFCWELVQSFGGMVDKCLNHQLGQTLER